MTPHLNRLTLEQLSVADLPPEKRQLAAGHLASCPRCQAVLEEIERARAARLERMPAARFAAELGARRVHAWRRRIRLMATMGALAAAALLLVLVKPREELRLKGAGFTLHRNRHGDVRVLGPGDKVRGGDALRLVMALPRPATVAAWFIDAHGKVDRVQEGATIRLPGGEHALPGSSVVDTPCVDLWLVVAVGAAANPRTEAALAKAAAAGISGNDWAPPGVWVRPLGCE